MRPSVGQARIWGRIGIAARWVPASFDANAGEAARQMVRPICLSGRLTGDPAQMRWDDSGPAVLMKIGDGTRIGMIEVKLSDWNFGE